MTDTQQTTTATAPADIANLTPSEASERLTARSADKGWRSKVLAGNGPEVQEFQALSAKRDEASRIDAALSGAEPAGIEMTSDENPLTVRQMATAAGWLREDGLSDATVRQVLEGGPVSKEEHRVAEQTLSRLMGDKQWAAKLMGGDIGAQRDHRLLHIIINSPIRE